MLSVTPHNIHAETSGRDTNIGSSADVKVGDTLPAVAGGVPSVTRSAFTVSSTSSTEDKNFGTKGKKQSGVSGSENNTQSHHFTVTQTHLGADSETAA